MRSRTKAAAVALAAATVTSATGLFAATSAGAANNVAAAGAAHVTVTMSKAAISFSTGTTLPAGLIKFTVNAKSGDHTLQLLRLHEGYTAKQANHDINASFSGDTKATKRIDTNITWLGGAEATADKPGAFEESLNPGSFVATDQNGNAFLRFTVSGTPAQATAVTPTATFSTKNNRWHTHTTQPIPRSGWIKFHNTAVEPHFIELNRVKDSTTNKMVRDYFASGSQNPPSFGLKASTGSGVLSPKHTYYVHYHLPAGKYLVACFWTSVQTGMPHAYMGMWKLIELS